MAQNSWLPLEIESETIFPIPDDARRGNPLSLAMVWVGANQNILALMTGMIYVKLCHLSLGWSLIAIVAGNIIGGVFMALHAAQGPHLGIPQMQQTRGQFGARGALLVIAVVIFMYVGFTAILLSIARDQSALLLGPAHASASVLLAACVVYLLCVMGHGMLERFVTSLSIIAGLCFVILALVYATFPTAHLAEPAFAAPSMHGLIMGVSIGVLWQIAYAPYVSDYSRYLPRDTGEKTAFYSCFFGSVAGTCLSTGIGAYMSANTFPGTYYDAARTISPAFPIVVFMVLMLSIAVGGAMNIYCATLSSLTFVHTFFQQWRPSHRARIYVALGLLVIAVMIALSVQGGALDAINDFIAMLLAVLSPWTAINLIDYYLIRHGRYDVASLCHDGGGEYGSYNTRALLSYAVGIVVQVPFLTNALFTGPIARALGGIDVSWMAGIGVPGLLYWLLSRWKRPAGQTPVPAGHTPDRMGLQ